MPGSGNGPGPLSTRGVGGMMLCVSGAGEASTLVGCGASAGACHAGRTTWACGLTGAMSPGGRVGSSAPGIGRCWPRGGVCGRWTGAW
ncbi:hypothetical protein [Amycolatopsis sp. EV170708-02-1]|uniref:hypothetical protein n=1 Tax=Amycolatopsis sp. EV170708-02-1 TaxID=2919322 RepID=UPI001F0C5BC2|nr:hypothetical protein [Amycolatopsis sp. EV170708-02-1]UMP07739.1 hypothetical protein MJQ72_39740 [Amycolatopsis sp. EV170708-02-1]